MLKDMCLSLVSKVTSVEQIKGPADSHLLPGERTAARVPGRQPDLPKKENFVVIISFITLFLRMDQSCTGLAQVFQSFFRWICRWNLRWLRLVRQLRSRLWIWIHRILLNEQKSSRVDSARRYYWLNKNTRKHLWKYFYPDITGRSSLKTIWIWSVKNQFY
jgi:hypothetical protein